MLPALIDAVRARGAALRHGELPRWRAALTRLPVGTRPSVRVDGATVVADGDADGGVDGGAARGPDAGARDASLRAALDELHPWRKGPFRIDGVDVDTEWRSDRKWDRVRAHLTPLAGRCTLDVGCGSGYHLWRMREAGAAAVLGVEPSPLYACQFEAVARCAPDAPVACLPLTLEALTDAFADLRDDAPIGAPIDAPDAVPDAAPGPAPPRRVAFDTVFSMGVLYHRSDPRDHLARLRALLRPGGELVLETLVPDRSLDAPLADVELDPAGRYARMGNVHPLPSVARLARLLGEAGFEGARAVSLDVTSTAEQRRTAWMRFDSLERALAPPDPATGEDDPYRLTVEGLPRPARAVLIAHAPRT